jgi:phosphoribosylanthranilate isomerase
LTSLVDAEAADAVGADYLGFILYPKSPRYVSFAQFAAMAPRLPPRKKVAVVVEPSLEELTAIKAAGFDHVQLHFANETPFSMAARWLDVISPEMLWLAPRVPPGKDFDLAFVPLAATIFARYLSSERLRRIRPHGRLEVVCVAPHAVQKK